MYNQSYVTILFSLVLILGNHDGYSKSDENKMMSALSLGNPETAYAHPKTDRSQSFVSSNCSSPYVILSSNCSPVLGIGNHVSYMSFCHLQAISYPYADSYYGGAVAAYGQHAIVSDLYASSLLSH